MSEKPIQTSDTTAIWRAEEASRRETSGASWSPPPKPTKRVYEYAVHPHDERYEFSSVFTTDAVYWLAEDAAEDFFNEHDGWDSSWPLTFRIFSDGFDLGFWSVDVERVPQFSATRLVA